MWALGIESRCCGKSGLFSSPLSHLPRPSLLSYAVSMGTTADLCWDSVTCLTIEISVHLPLFLQIPLAPCSLLFGLCIMLRLVMGFHGVLFIFISLHFFLLHRPGSCSDHFLCLLPSVADPCSEVSIAAAVLTWSVWLCLLWPLLPSSALVVLDHVFSFARVDTTFIKESISTGRSATPTDVNYSLSSVYEKFLNKSWHLSFLVFYLTQGCSFLQRLLIAKFCSISSIFLLKLKVLWLSF